MSLHILKDKIKDKSGQINISFATATVIVIASIGGVYGLFDRSYSKAAAVEVRVSAVEGDIKGINSKLDLIVDYFKLTPKIR